MRKISTGPDRGIVVVAVVISVLVLTFLVFPDPEPIEAVGTSTTLVEIPTDSFSVNQELDVPYYLEPFWECHKLCAKIEPTYRTEVYGGNADGLACHKGCGYLLLDCK